MTLVGIFVCLIIGAGVGVGIVLILQAERVYTGAKNLHRLAQSIRGYRNERKKLLRELENLEADVADLNKSVMQIVNERDALEMAWYVDRESLQNTNRVVIEEAIVYGRGREWVYLYTFPTTEQLAHERRQKYFPMKLGMSTQENVVTRVHQQVSGNSTAIAERAVVRLVFRVNNAREVEQWMHEHLTRNGRQVPDSVGVEWFNTNPVEVEQLFRSYVLQKTRVPRASTVPKLTVTEFLDG